MYQCYLLYRQHRQCVLHPSKFLQCDLCCLSLCTEASAVSVVFSPSLCLSTKPHQISPEPCGYTDLASFCSPFETLVGPFRGFYTLYGHFSDYVYNGYLGLLITIRLTLCQLEVGHLRIVKAAGKMLNRYGLTIHHYLPSFAKIGTIWKYTLHICALAILVVNIVSQYFESSNLYKGSIVTT